MSTTAFYLVAFLISIIFLTSVSASEECCKKLGVPELCYPTLCNPTVIPELMHRYKVFERWGCQDYLQPVAQCLARGRDATACCWKTAKDDFYDYCFGFCNGTQPFHPSKKNPLISCFVVNSVTMFPCLMESYKSAPSFPRELEVISKTESTANIRWKEPAELPELVYLYKIHLIERANGKDIESTYDTKDLEFVLDDLVPTSSYAVHVVAYAEDYKGKAGWFKSASSNIVLFTTGPEIELNREILKTPANTTYLRIPCTLKRIYRQEPDVEWVKLSENGTMELLNSTDPKYNISSYFGGTRKDIMAAVVVINNFTSTDFGTYRCYIKDTRIEYKTTVVTEYSHSDAAPPEFPPLGPLQCCRQGMKTSQCASLCDGGDIDRNEELQLEQLVPQAAKCENVIERLRQCTLTKFNSAGCCINKRIPYHCLGMCDARFPLSFFEYSTCQQYTSAIHACQFELMDLMPEAVSYIKAVYYARYTYRFTWEPADAAEVYHIYFREEEGTWHSRVTLDTTMDITDTDEVIFIAVNGFGTSGPHRMIYDHDQDRWRSR